jgi:acetylornithine/succinyldiaminopimelate/putrescine aminotransferase/predicted amino acid dehydrogenase
VEGRVARVTALEERPVSASPTPVAPAASSARKAPADDDRNNPELRRLTRLCGLDRRFVHGEGAWLTDSTGRRFLDAYAQYGAVVLGHNAPAVREAVEEALRAGVPAMVQPHEAAQAEELGRALADAVPGRPRRCVFGTSGADAVEAAIKLVRARSGRAVILSASGSFHGRTLGALAATGQAHHREGFGPMPPGFETVPFGDADALAYRLERDGDRIAAFFVEPVQGESGVHVPPADYLARARTLCDRHGAALVVDEVQTGLGRTGPLFAVSGAGVTPDVLLLAKGLGGGLFPLSACLVAEAWWSPRFALGHSSTFASNNVACAAGMAVLRALAAPHAGAASLLAHAVAVGAHLGEGLRSLQRRFPELVCGVRGRGLLWGLELAAPADQDGLLLGYLGHQGLFAYAVAGALAETASVLTLPALGTRHVLRVAPPLVFDRAQADAVVEGLGQLFARLQERMGATLLRGMGWTATEADPVAVRGECVALPQAAPHPQVVRFGRRRRWAFLVHYTRLRDVRSADPTLEALSDDELRRVCDRAAQLPGGIVLEAPLIASPATGKEVEGSLIGLPWLPEHLRLRGRERTGQAIREAVDLARRLGADVVGLGGFTAPFSDRGRDVVGRGPAITTGNVLTAAVAVDGVERALLRLRLDPRACRVAVVGALGSVGLMAARLLARWRPARLVLVGNPSRALAPLEARAAELTWPGGAAEAASSLASLGGCDVVISASGAGRDILQSAVIAPGTIICDVARPPDTPAALRARADVTVLEGGLVRLPDSAIAFGPGNLQGLPRGVVLACLAETLLHALDGTTADTGVGYDVPVEAADRVMAMAARHGFTTWEPR